jgi:hypothetical protein
MNFKFKLKFFAFAACLTFFSFPDDAKAQAIDVKVSSWAGLQYYWQNASAGSTLTFEGPINAEAGSFALGAPTNDNLTINGDKNKLDSKFLYGLFFKIGDTNISKSIIFKDI